MRTLFFLQYVIYLFVEYFFQKQHRKKLKDNIPPSTSDSRIGSCESAVDDPGGSVGNISSTELVVPVKDQANGCKSKSGGVLHNLMKSTLSGNGQRPAHVEGDEVEQPSSHSANPSSVIVNQCSVSQDSSVGLHNVLGASKSVDVCKYANSVDTMNKSTVTGACKVSNVDPRYPYTSNSNSNCDKAGIDSKIYSCGSDSCADGTYPCEFTSCSNHTSAQHKDVHCAVSDEHGHNEMGTNGVKASKPTCNDTTAIDTEAKKTDLQTIHLSDKNEPQAIGQRDGSETDSCEEDMAFSDKDPRCTNDINTDQDAFEEGKLLPFIFPHCCDRL